MASVSNFESIDRLIEAASREPDIHRQLGQLGEQEIAQLRRQVQASRQAIELAALDPLQAFESLEAKLAQDERILQAESQQVPVPLAYRLLSAYFASLPLMLTLAALALYPILGFTTMK